MKKLLLITSLLSVGCAFGGGSDNGFDEFNNLCAKTVRPDASYVRKANFDTYKRDSADLETYLKSQRSFLECVGSAMNRPSFFGFSKNRARELSFEVDRKGAELQIKLAEENKKKAEKTSIFLRPFLCDNNKDALALAFARIHALRVEILDKHQ